MPRTPEVLRLLAGDGPDAELVARRPDEVAGPLRAAVGRHTDPESAGQVGRSMRRIELVRVACADLLGLVDVTAVCGPKGRHDPARTATRHGHEAGSVSLGVLLQTRGELPEGGRVRGL